MIGRIARPDDEGIRAAVALLRAGSVVAFPTETVYGLGADAFSPRAVGEIYRLKNRPSWNPLIVHVATVEAARQLAATWPEAADRLAAACWPGPLTMVVRRAPGLGEVGAADDTIAVRIPAHEVASAAARGVRLAARGAQRQPVGSTFRQPPPSMSLRRLPEVPLVLDGGPCRWGIESTVLDLTTAVPTLLRPGALSLRAVREVTGAIALRDAENAEGAARPSPGMSRRHYAPGRDRAAAKDVREVDPAGLAGPVGVLSYEACPSSAESGPSTGPSTGTSTGPSSGAEILSADPREYAADLYAALHRLDDAGVATILVQEPPPTEDWLAVA